MAGGDPQARGIASRSSSTASPKGKPRRRRWGFLCPTKVEGVLVGAFYARRRTHGCSAGQSMSPSSSLSVWNRSHRFYVKRSLKDAYPPRLTEPLRRWRRAWHAMAGRLHHAWTNRRRRYMSHSVPPLRRDDGFYNCEFAEGTRPDDWDDRFGLAASAHMFGSFQSETVR